MNKVIHAPYAATSSRFRRALDTFTDGDQARAAALHRAWANFDAQLTEHHEGEHEIAWPALKAVGVDQATIDGFDHEHERWPPTWPPRGRRWTSSRHTASRADADAAGAAMAQPRDHDPPTSTTRRRDRAAAGQARRRPAIKEMGKKFSRRTGIGKAGAFFAWLEDGATAEEKAGLRDNVPGPVVTIIGGLFGRGYRKEVAPVWASSGSF